jgi:hypothetical protein
MKRVLNSLDFPSIFENVKAIGYPSLITSAISSPPRLKRRSGGESFGAETFYICNSNVAYPC